MNWLIQALNGLSFGMLLFLIAAGLSVSFGVMRVLNLSHGSFFLLGGYLGLAVLGLTGNFLAAAVAAAVLVAALGFVVQRLLLWRIRHDELAQVLMTLGVLLILSDLALLIWGGSPTRLPEPAFLQESVGIGGRMFPTYRLFLIGFGLLIAAGQWWLIERTRVGAVVRAGVDDAELAQTHGINIPAIFTLVFAVGAALAGLGGVVGGPIVGMYPGADIEVLTLALVVIVVGGLGSVEGALVGSLLVGLVDSFGKALFPELALFTVYAPMVVILALRPQGLLGART
ncbi:MAG: branched-chain amino acid ABC transporter permease [Streptosporangiales bacterium]|nr:branched-chain amino acid ABC transporter permease [Streptosporangiales bacterium]